MAALNHVFLVYGHIVTQIVKAHLVIRAVGDVGIVCRLTLVVIEPVDDKSDGKSHEAVYLAHPLAVTAGKIVIDGDDVNTLAGQCIEVCRQNGDKGLAFAGLHLGDASLMQDDAADKLHSERLHAENTPRSLSDSCKRLGKQSIEILAALVALLELLRLCPKLLVAQRLKLRLERLDLVDYRVYSLKLTVGVTAE